MKLFRRKESLLIVRWMQTRVFGGAARWAKRSSTAKKFLIAASLVIIKIIWRPFEMLQRKYDLNPNYMLVIVLAVIISIWMLSGILFRSSAEPHSAAGRTNELPRTVLVKRAELEPTNRLVRISGKTQEERKVEIKAELSGTVEKILVAEGTKVDANYSIIQLEQEEVQARLAKADAQEKMTRLEYSSQQNLRQRGLTSEADAAQAEANYEDAKASVTLARKQYEAAQVRAPFNGTVEQIYVEQGDFVQPGQLLASIYDYSPMLVIGALSELEVSLVNVGTNVSVSLVTGRELTGRVRYVAAQSDAASRTFEVKIEVNNTAGEVFAGLTAEVDFEVEQVKAMKITPALLTISDGGKLGIKAVRNDGDVVMFVPVEVIKAETNEMWVSGIDDDMWIITRGFGFVEPGEKVETIEDTKS